jgi:hypothetical protein
MGDVPVDYSLDVIGKTHLAELVMNPDSSRRSCATHASWNIGTHGLMLEEDAFHFRVVTRPRDRIEVIEQSL